LYGTYTVTLSNLKSVLQTSASQKQKAAATTGKKPEGIRRRLPGTTPEETKQFHKHRHPAEGQKESSGKNTCAEDSTECKKVPTIRNYFAPLRTPQMEAEENEPPTEEQQTSSAVSGRPPPIVLTSAINRIQLQSHLKDTVKGNFAFRSTGNGTRVVTREMADYSAIREYSDSKKINYFTFYPKSERPVKAVIRHLPINTPAEDISNSLQDLGYSELSVKQMTASRPSPGGGNYTLNLPPFPSNPNQTLKVTRNL
jgi:hypothetical protein